jgi:hypothetical protein
VCAYAYAYAAAAAAGPALWLERGAPAFAAIGMRMLRICMTA